MQAETVTGLRWVLHLGACAALAVPLPGNSAEATAEDPNRPEPALAQRPWVELRTDGFCTYSPGPTQELAKVLARLEQFRFCYAQLAGAQSVASPPIQVYAFENDAELMPFKPRYQGRPSNVAGYFMRRPDALVIALSLSGNTTNTLQLLFHEYTHFLLRRNHFWPVWLSEGMADLYSTLEVEGDTVVLGRPPRYHLRTLAKGPLMPLSGLFAVTQESPDYNEQDKQGMVYAQSWLLAHYLATTDDAVRRRRFGDYTRLLRDGRGPEEAFTRAMQTTLPAMEKELKDYAARGEYRPLTLRARAKPRVAMRQRSLEVPETSFLLGHLLLHLKREDEAREFFEQARRLQPRGPFGDQGLGLLAAYQDRPAEAIRHLEQAQQFGSKNYLVHYWLGWERLMQLKEPNGNFRSLPPEQAARVNNVRAPLQEAIRLMPSFAPAHFGLGFLELVLGEDLPAAERLLAAAHRMAPDDSRYGLSLARAYLTQQKQAPARELLQELSKTGATKEAKMEAARLLEQYGGVDR